MSTSPAAKRPVSKRTRARGAWLSLRSQAGSRSDLWRIAASLGLGATAYVLLPVFQYPPAVFGSLVARAIVSACVVGLLGVQARPRWVVLATSTCAVLIGFLVLCLINPLYFSAVGVTVGVLCAGALSFGIAALVSTRLRVPVVIACIAIVLLVALWFAGFLPGPLQQEPASGRQSSLAQVPQPKQYSFDGADFLKTYYLMKQGAGYYAAFRQGVTEDSRHDANYMQSPFNYREPLIFEIWRFLPGSNGNDLLAWFVVWSLGTMVAAYMLASALVEPGVALLAPIALIRFFFFFWWQGSWFTTTEVWAAAFAVAAVAALLRKQRVASVLLLIAAVAAREFMVVLIPAWLVVWWLTGGTSRRARLWFPIAAVVGPAAVLAAHLLLARPLTPGANSGLSGWLHGGPARLIAALRFGWSPSLSALGAPEATWLPLVIAAAAIVAAALARPRWRAGALICATVLPILFLLTISAGEWHYYWGPFYTPLAVAVAPGIFGRILPPWPRSMATPE